MTQYTIIHDEASLSAALKLARGCYQRNILFGVEALSGATIKGRAREWGARYATSRAHLLARMTRAGVPWSQHRGPHGKRILVLGTAP